jgi:hypothetical protein
VRVAIDQRLNLEAIRRISDAQLIQLVDEAARKGGLKATPKDDDTFLNDEKGCLFLLNAVIGNTLDGVNQENEDRMRSKGVTVDIVKDAEV